MSFIIRTITAFVATDENDGDEGVIGVYMNGVMMPLVCADEARIASLLPVAKDVCRRERKTFRILQFSVREDVTDKYLP